MDWILFLTAAICYLVMCNGQSQGDSSCDCDSDDVNQECLCEYNEDGYKERVVVIAVASVTMVGILGVIVGCWVYNKKWKNKRTKTMPEKAVEVHQISDKRLLPAYELTWTSLPRTPPPPYTGTTLPYYHPETRDTSLAPPPPYTSSYY